MSLRIIITGSRDWTNKQLLAQVIMETAEGQGEITIVTGACPTGADRLAEDLAEFMGWAVEKHHAQWEKYGKAAGPMRNKEMTEAGADICLAFIKNKSKGATHGARISREAGIATSIYREDTHE